MEPTLTDRVLATPPKKAEGIPSRYKWLSISLSEPNLGITPPKELLPTESDFWSLSSDEFGNRGWAAGEKPYIYAKSRNDYSIIPALGENTMYAESSGPFPTRSTISGGEKNVITYSNSIIGAGFNNKILSTNQIGSNSLKGFDFIGSGDSNEIVSAEKSSILNGAKNTINIGSYNQILNGIANELLGSYTTIINGNNNEALGSYNIIAGSNNKTKSNYINVFNGSNNTSFSKFSNILNGSNNTIEATTINSILSSVSLNQIPLFSIKESFIDAVRVTTCTLGDRIYIFVSSPFQNNGEVYVYYIDKEKLIYDNRLISPTDLTFQAQFGFDISVDEENNKIYISAPNQNNVGAVYVYEYDPRFLTVSQSVESSIPVAISPSVLNVGEKFGNSIKCTPLTLLVGAPNFNNGTGRVFLFKKTQIEDTFSDYVIIEGEQEDSRFGYAVTSNLSKINSITDNVSGAIAIAAPYYSLPGKPNVGTVYLYTVGLPSNSFNTSFYSVLTGVSNIFTSNSRIGETRFLAFDSDIDPETNDNIARIKIPAPYYTQNNGLSGGIVRISFNNAFAGSIASSEIITIPLSSSNLGFSKSRNFISSNLLFGINDKSETNDGVGLIYSKDFLSDGDDIIVPAVSGDYYYFGSSIDYTRPYAVTVGLDKITNFANLFVFNYIPKNVLNSNSTILAGSNNIIAGYEGFIPFGNYNTINQDTTQTIVAGSNNTLQGNNSNISILGNRVNVLTGVRDAFVFGSDMEIGDSNTTYVENISVTKVAYGDGSGLNPAGVLYYNRETKSAGIFSDFFPLSGGDNNLVLGYGSGNSIFGGSNNTLIGVSAGYLNSSGASNIFIGDSTGYNNTVGSNNIFLGKETGVLNVGGSNNIFLGLSSGQGNTAGENNIFLGTRSGAFNAIGTKNINIGFESGINNNTGNNNIFLGEQSGYSNTEGYRNIFVGKGAGISNITGYDNILIGNNAGDDNVNANNNIVIGNNAETNNYNNVIILGNNADAVISDTLVIGSLTNPLSVIKSTTMPLTSNGDFLLIRINGINRAIKLFDYQ
jgi:hypothetical protein